MIKLRHKLAVSSLWLLGTAALSTLAAHSNIDDRHAVVATIGQQDVTVAEVDLLLGRNADSDPLPERTLEISLSILAKQRRALETMRKFNIAATPAAIDRWIETQAARQPDNPPRDNWLSSQAKLAGVSEIALRESIVFRLSWKAYLDQHLSEDTLEKHYNNQPHRFDGSKFSIERISIPVPVGQSQERDDAIKQLSELRQKFVNESSDVHKINASELVLREETITGNSPVDPEILDFVVKAKPMRWSQPVHSVVGVHLIRVREIEKGNADFTAVKDEVRAQLLVYLLDYLARQSAELLPLRLKTSDEK